MSNLAERLDTFPEAWRPTNAGEKLIGEVTDVDLRESEYGDPYPIVTVLVESGQEDGRQLEPGVELAWHAFHTMARNEVAKRKPQVGERVGVVYAGLGEAKPGMNAPARWRLLVDRPRKPVDYSALAESDKAEEVSNSPDPDAESEIPDHFVMESDAEGNLELSPGSTDEPADDDIPF